jgi:hypothetical protein
MYAAGQVGRFAGQQVSRIAQRYGDRAANYVWEQLQGLGRAAYARAGTKRRATSSPSRARKVRIGRRPAVFSSYMHRRGWRRRRIIAKRRSIRPQRSGYRTRRGGYATTKPLLSPFASKGFIEKYENGGTLDDANSVYLGVSTCPTGLVMVGICRVVVRELMNQFSQDFASWESQPTFNTNGTLDIRFYYYNDINDTTVRTGVITAIATTDTYQNIADNLRNNVRTALNAQPDLILKEIRLTELDGAVEMTRATIRPKEFYIDIDSYSNISIQNRTQSATAGEGATETDQVTNNPVHGKVYRCKGNAFIPKYRQDPGIGFVPIVAHRDSGLIQFGAATQVLNQYKKPPPSTFFKQCTSQAKTFMNPASIRMYTVKTKKSFSLNGLIERFGAELGNSFTLNEHYQLGDTVMVGLEKVIDTRSAEPNVAIGYELNTTFKMKYRYKRAQFTAPIVSVV